MKTTGNLGLKKPEGTDLVDIADLNGNMDILDNAVNGKVDKVSGKQLSTNDYTTPEKTKLAGIATGANNYTHPNHTGDVTSTGDGVTAIAAGVIVDTDVNANAGIKFSKINAAGSIMDSDINDEAYINMLKIGTGRINNDLLDTLYGVTGPIQGQINSKVSKIEGVTHTTSNMTIYVRPDGVDTNTGQANTAAGAFKTITRAISAIPQVLNHEVVINIAAGTYAGDVLISGFGGDGSLKVTNSGTIASGIVVVPKLTVSSCSAQVTITGITASSTTSTAIEIIACTWVWLEKCYTISGASNQYGVSVYGATAILSDGIYSNRATAIWARNASNVFVTNIQGANNGTGYLATEGSKIGLSANTLTAVLLSDARQGGLILGDPRESSIPLQTNADVTYYVRTDGNDNNAGATNTAGGALKTIQKALSLIPMIVNHTVTINVGAGTYPEEVAISGFSGRGAIQLNGDTVVSSTRTAHAIVVTDCSCRTEIVGFNASRTTTAGFTVRACSDILISRCSVITSSSTFGFYIDSAKAYLNECQVSNRYVGVYAHINGEILVQYMKGSGNTIGYNASYGGTISVSLSQMVGTQMYSTAMGGNIHSAEGVLNPWGDNTTISRSFISAWANAPDQLTASTWTKLTFGNKVYDHLGEFSTTTNRFTATKEGVYLVSASISLATLVLIRSVL